MGASGSLLIATTVFRAPFHGRPGAESLSGNADRDVDLRRNRLARAADLTIHRQPAGVADGPGSGKLGAESLGQRFDDRDVFLLLDPAADGDDDVGGGQIDGACCFPERGLGHLPRRRGRWRECFYLGEPSARHAPAWIEIKCGPSPTRRTSALNLPWNIWRTNTGGRRRSRRRSGSVQSGRPAWEHSRGSDRCARKTTSVGFTFRTNSSTAAA